MIRTAPQLSRTQTAPTTQLRATRRRASARIGIGVVLLIALGPATQANPTESELLLLRVKAAYVYNLTLYTRWPQQKFHEPTDPIVIAVVGNPEFADILEKSIAEKTVDNRRLRVKRIAATLSPADISKECLDGHMIYISASDTDRLPDIVAPLRTAGVLIVSDSKDSARRGAHVELVIRDGKLAMDVNQKAALKSGLELSSKLLKLARIVED